MQLQDQKGRVSSWRVFFFEEPLKKGETPGPGIDFFGDY